MEDRSGEEATAIRVLSFVFLTNDSPGSKKAARLGRDF